MKGTIRNMLAGSFMAGTLIIGGTAIAAHPTTLTPPPSVAPSGTQRMDDAATPGTSGTVSPMAHRAANPKQRAARELNTVYRKLGVLTTNAALPASAQQLVDTTKRTYGDALNAFNSGDYQHSAALARVAQTTATVTQRLVRQEQGTIAVPGVATPPAATRTVQQQHAHRTLERAYNRLNAARAANSSDATVNDLIAQGSSLYQTALDEYNAGRFEAAQRRAETARDLAVAALRYNRSLTRASSAPATSNAPVASAAPASVAPSAAP